MSTRGPLAGVRILDLSGLGPAPFATMMLADFGADILSVRRPDPMPFDPAVTMSRGKDVIGLDLRSVGGQEVARRLALQSDVLVEGFRPGVMERLGLGPAPLIDANPRLIYARLTGWGQTGPYARKAGHDINYLAISGALGQIGTDRPTAPPAFLGDLANGSYTMVIGVLLALFERQRTGRGQIIDAAIVDGAAYMLGAMFGEMELGLWDGDIRHSILAGDAPFYGTYRCSDDRWFTVGAIEPKFYSKLLELLELDDVDPSPRAQFDFAQWPALRSRIAAIFAAKPRAWWTDLFAPHEVCAEPVLELDELDLHPHLAERGIFHPGPGKMRSVAPAPRLSAHPGLVETLNPRASRPVQEIVEAAGFSKGDIDALLASGTIWHPEDDRNPD